MSQKAVLKAIKKGKVFLISSHVSVDVDGIASELAMALYLKSLGKTVDIINEEKIPPMYSFLPQARLIKAFKGRGKNYDTVIIFDCGDLQRIGKVKTIVPSGKTVINIDHHITNRGFGKINLVKPQASSTCEVLYDLFKVAGFKITKTIAQLLYLGIMTDTGSFRYCNTSSHTHRATSDLLKFGFSVNKFYRKIYENIPLRDLKHFTKVINRFELTHRNQVVSVTITKDRIGKFSGHFDLRDKIFSFLRSIKGVEVVVIFTEISRNLIRVNFRSQGKINVATLASFFKGGGHQRASGCRIRGSTKGVKQKVYGRLKKILT